MSLYAHSVETVQPLSTNISSHAFASSLPRFHQSEEHMDRAPETITVFNQGEHSATWRHRSTTGECADWLKDKLRRKSAKLIADEAGVGQRAAESIKLGRNALTMAHLVSMCRADETFRTHFFKFCGGHLEGEPEMVAALSKAINAVMQQGAKL